ncbi:hypothetical protein [uncultured Lacinutrix sp.]|uniref:hypothetical protein n=1 Tax=uncultured Lacinutrix sp. TaxID=574032 RepID=UPI002610F78C|nr:hypothetical protein [uncultured Lacinutrix sp.]
MKKLLLVFLSLITSISFCQDFKGKLSYNISFKIDKDQFLSILKSNFIQNEIKTKEDSLFMKKINEDLKKSVQNKKLDTNVEYFVFKDTVIIKTKEAKHSLITSNFDHYTNRTTELNYYCYKVNFSASKNLNWKTSYDIKIDRNDTISVLGLNGYKVKIVEAINTSIGVLKQVAELYLSTEINVPIHYYDFLKLKKKLKLEGLIIQAKIYDIDTPKIFELYTLTDYNTKPQNKDLIKSFDYNYKN